MALSTQSTLLELQRQLELDPVNDDEQEVGIVGHEEDVNVDEPQQYWLLSFTQTMIASLQRQLTVPLILLQAEGAVQDVEGNVL